MVTVRNIFIYWFNSHLIRSGALLLGFGLITSGLGYSYQVLLGRILLPTEFALFSASVGVAIFISSFFGALGLPVVKKVAALNLENKGFIPRAYYFRLYTNATVVAFVFLVISVFLVPHIKLVLNTDSSFLIWIINFYIVISMFYSINYSIFQGLQKFYYMSILSILSIVFKIFFSIGFIYYGLGVPGALLGMLLSLMAAVFFSIFIICKHLSNSTPSTWGRVAKADVKLYAAIYFSGIATTALTQLDLVYVNWYFPGAIAGEYAAVAVLGKGVLYLPGALALAIYPMAAENFAKGVDSKKLLLQGLLATLMFSVVIVALFMVAGAPLLNILFNGRYIDAGNILAFYALAMIPVALIILTENYLIAKGKVLFAWLFFAITPLELFVLHHFHDTLLSFIVIIGVFSSLLAIIGLLIIFITLRVQNRK